MKYEELKDIVKTGEGYTIELKESLNSSIGKEICAFANAMGGKIILGVEDNTNKIKGYKIKNSDLSKIQDIARNMSPGFNVQIEQIKDLVVIYVPIGKDKPYTVNGHFYMRYGANSQQLNRDEIRNLFQKENLISFEQQAKEYDEKDFSMSAFNKFKEIANLDKKLSKEHILKNLNLLTNNKINNAGILYFTENIKQYFPTAIVSCFLYSDNEQTDIIDTKEFNSDFKTNLEEAYKYVISKLNNAIIIEGKIQHKRKLELPKIAIREAIINAMIHKDYFKNSTVQINISPEKVEIINPGSLLFPKTELGSTSAYRNPVLADLMQRMKEIEKAGSGIKRIKRLCKQNKIKIEFKAETYFRTIFYRNKTSQKPAKNQPKTSQKPAKIKRKEKILEHIKKNTFSKRSFAEEINMNRSTIESDLEELKEKGIIKFIGSRRGGKWVLCEEIKK